MTRRIIGNGIDLNGFEVELRVERGPDGFRLWVNAPDCVLRAYKIPHLALAGLALAAETEGEEKT